MKRPIFTHCALRLGDNLAHLHFLRALAKRHLDQPFIHFAHQAYLPNLIELVGDLPNLDLKDLESVTDTADENGKPLGYWEFRPNRVIGSVDSWKNAAKAWERHELRHDYAVFMLQHFARLAHKLGGFEPVFFTPNQLLFDYPALLRYEAKPFDILIVNSSPQSGQLAAYSPEVMAALAHRLAASGRRVVTTSPVRGLACTQFQLMTVTHIGAIARHARVIIGVATGPLWPCLNTFLPDGPENFRVLLCDEQVDYVPRSICVPSPDDALRQLQVRGIL